MTYVCVTCVCDVCDVCDVYVTVCVYDMCLCDMCNMCVCVTVCDKVAHDFITAEECATLHDYAHPRLTRATVAGENGMSTVSMNRRAQQAGYADIRDPSDPLWDLQARLFEFVNSKTGYGLQLAGQEPPTVIQYNVEDEYTPHCDVRNTPTIVTSQLQLPATVTVAPTVTVIVIVT